MKKFKKILKFIRNASIDIVKIFYYEIEKKVRKNNMFTF
jgi:hypothetical protein